MRFDINKNLMIALIKKFHLLPFNENPIPHFVGTMFKKSFCGTELKMALKKANILEHTLAFPLTLFRE